MNLVSVGPHAFKPLRRWFNKGRCRACYEPESKHPTQNYVAARPLRDYRNADASRVEDTPPNQEREP